MNRTIIGIDPGLANMGYGIIGVSGNKNTHLAHGVLTTSAHPDTGARLAEIYRGLCELLDRYSPDGAGVEDLYFAKNSKTYAAVAQAKGVVLLTLAQRGIPVTEYSPLVIKRALVGNGRAEKTQVQELVRVILGLSERPEPDHASDALAAAICHANQSALKDLIRKAGGGTTPASRRPRRITAKTVGDK